MEKEFLSYEVSHILSDKNFDEECIAYYNSNGNLKFKSDKTLSSGIKKQDLHQANILAPLYQQVIRWLSVEYNIHIMFSEPDIMDQQIKAALKTIHTPLR